MRCTDLMGLFGTDFLVNNKSIIDFEKLEVLQLD